MKNVAIKLEIVFLRGDINVRNLSLKIFAKFVGNFQWKNFIQLWNSTYTIAQIALRYFVPLQAVCVQQKIIYVHGDNSAVASVCVETVFYDNDFFEHVFYCE